MWRLRCVTFSSTSRLIPLFNLFSFRTVCVSRHPPLLTSISPPPNRSLLLCYPHYFDERANASPPLSHFLFLFPSFLALFLSSNVYFSSLVPPSLFVIRSMFRWLFFFLVLFLSLLVYSLFPVIYFARFTVLLHSQPHYFLFSSDSSWFSSLDCGSVTCLYA